MNRKPDSSAKYKIARFQDIECQVVEVDGLIQLTDRDYYLPESRTLVCQIAQDAPSMLTSCSIYIGTIWVHESRASEICHCELCAYGRFQTWMALVAARQGLPESRPKLCCTVTFRSRRERDRSRIPPQGHT
jgi:hypothetical protein